MSKKHDDRKSQNKDHTVIPANQNPVIKNAVDIKNSQVLVLLDTNVYMRHQYTMKHLEEIESLREECPGLSVLLPKTVFKECRNNLFKMIEKWRMPNLSTEVVSELESLHEKGKRALKDYWLKWKKSLLSTTVQLPTKARVLKRAYERLLRKDVPCRTKEEFRDAVIWESLLDCAKDDCYLVFVTDNTKDFPYREAGADAASVRFHREFSERRVLFFATFNDFLSWIKPIRKPRHLVTTLPESVKYSHEPAKFIDDTRVKLEESLEDKLCDYVELFDGNAELIEVFCDSFSEVSSYECGEDLDDEEKEGTCDWAEYEYLEEWKFKVSFSLSGGFWVGGSDGVELRSSGSDVATGTATVKRAVYIENGVISEQATVSTIDIQYNNDWDPRDHFAEHQE